MPAKPTKKEPHNKVPLNEDRILVLSATMATMKEIAADQNCSVDTLERRAADLIKKGHERAKLSLRRRQFSMAMGVPAQYDENGKIMFPAILPSVTMQIWLGKQYLDQSDKFKVDEGEASGFKFVD